MGAAQRAVVGVDANLGAILIAQNLGVLINDGAGGLGGARQPLGVLQGVQMTAARVDHSRKIALAAHMALKLIAIEQAHRFVGVLLVELASP